MTHETPTDPPADDEAARLLEAGLSTPAPFGRTPPPPPEALAEQFPAFEVLEVLGQGGMGVVYKARQRKLDRLVALKVLPRELSEDPAFTERFAREGRTLAKLQHAHIVGVHDFGEADGQYYIVMEYVDGVNLRALIDSGELTSKEALTIVPQICEALQYAHDMGVVHRDIKPENVMLDRTGSVKVADFGLAKLVERAPGDFTLTGTDQVMGTLHYMAPEQYKTPQDVDHRADIFSLGVVFYEMLTGDLPVGRFQDPSKTGELDSRIDAIVMRTLEREREERYQHAREVRTAVTSFAESGPPPAAAAHETPLRRAVGEVEDAARNLWSGERLSDLDDPADRVGGAPRRWSRWVVAALIMLPLSAAVGGLAYAVIDAFGDPAHGRTYREVAGWIVFLIGIGCSLVLAIVAVILTQTYRERIRGQWLSIGTFLVGIAAVMGGFLGLNEAVKDSIYWRRALSPLEQGGPIRDVLTRGSIHVSGAKSNADAVRIRRDVAETWGNFLERVAVKDLGRDDFHTANLYSYEDRRILDEMASSDADGYAEKLAQNGLGMGFIGQRSAPHPLHEYQLRSIAVEAWGRTARVTLERPPADPRGQPDRIHFPVKRTEDGWAFAIGPVRFE